MKRRDGIALLIIGALISTIIASAATGPSSPGSASDPLLSLDWIKNAFIPDTVSKAEERVEGRLDGLAGPLSSAGAVGPEFRLKRGDVLTLETGSGLTCLAGELDGAAASGTVVDTTAGEELGKERNALVLNHRYLAAEATIASFTVTSDTAVVRLTGAYKLSKSNEVDYNALANALKSLGLFKGSDVPYGLGYELESAPTRIQGLIMFLRLMGEEEDALAYSGGDFTFPDVPDWALPYVAYAYDKGYTKGYGVNDRRQVTFGTADPLGAKDYMTFLLRALGHVEGTDFNWLTAIPAARTLGVLTEGEAALLTERPFLRAQVVYLSYFALSANLAGGRITLADHLLAEGTLDVSTLAWARSSVTVQRL